MDGIIFKNGFAPLENSSDSLPKGPFRIILLKIYWILSGWILSVVPPQQGSRAWIICVNTDWSLGNCIIRVNSEGWHLLIMLRNRAVGDYSLRRCTPTE